METQSNITDVLTGKESIKVDVNIPTKTLVALGVTLVLVIVIGIVTWQASKKI